MDESMAGVDYHEEGAQMPSWLLALLLLTLGIPVGLVAFLMLWVLPWAS